MYMITNFLMQSKKTIYMQNYITQCSTEGLHATDVKHSET